MSKTGYLVLGVCAVSLLNMQWGDGNKIKSFATTRVWGGPAAIEENNTFLNFEESIVHDALVGVSGQRVVEVLEDAAQRVVGMFSLPAQGINWGDEHPQNAVDIAGRCGTSLYAASAGQAVTVRTEGWNGGYGKYIDINHGDGITTRYAHINTSAVVQGQMVAAGEVIGTMGSTGESTGCHVHFEVRGGAKNPFVNR